MEAAKRLLTETELSVGAIAERVGYARQSHFGAVFQKLLGLTPKAYRRRSQTGLP
jgi:two-component system response regulator YesN